MSFFTAHLAEFEILGSVLVALLLGGLIGVEREVADKPAGLRTHMLVAAASALVVDLGDVVIANLSGSTGQTVIQADPLRIIEAVTAGISFLGAGTILRRRGESRVEGLTTAASILFTAGVGISVALSQYIVAVGSTVLALVTLRLIRSFEGRFPNNYNEEKQGEEHGKNVERDTWSEAEK
ncbi:MAG: MgtC/SapB family protein [Candidatus Promineifilaceae bacterium]|nr:MgtC/SapB family protein [Candidatus Promineifilaceae bacterium]